MVQGVGNLSSRRSISDLITRVINVLFQESKNVVQDIVAVGLLCQKKGLGKLVRGLALVGHFTQDLDNDSTVA